MLIIHNDDVNLNISYIQLKANLNTLHYVKFICVVVNPSDGLIILN